jgi:spoIIIJ-associated protein
MEWVETTGRTVAAALDAALDELGVDEDDVEFEVVAEPKSGFLGMGASDARIRARVKPISREKPGERQRRRGRKDSRGGGKDSRGGGNGGRRGSGSGSGGNGGNGGNGGRKAATSAAAADAQDAGEAGDSGRTAATSTGGGDREPGEARGTAAGAAGTGTARKRRRGGRGRGGSSRPAAQNGGDAESQDKPRAQDRVRNQQESSVVSSEEDVPIEEQAAAAEEFTQGLVDAFDLGGRVETVIEEDVVTVSVYGDNLGLLVGPKGSTLHAIEELVRTVVQRQTDGHGVRIHVDVAGYRAKRRAALEEFTQTLVDKVLESGKAQALEPMSAADRKVVHDTAGAIEGVTTESQGDDPRRRVVIRRA